ncbi:MAG: hypothetical protein ABJB66_07360 [Gemmatimonadaceae bacterium]
MRRVRPTTIASTVAVIISTACSDSSTLPPADGKLALGTWGGDNAAVIATDSVTHIHVGCTFGDMPPQIMLDANGKFEIDGNYMLHAYPVSYGPTVPAHFSGQVRGNTLSVSVSVNDTVEKKIVPLGPISVTLGKTPSMGPCPVCIVPKQAFMMKGLIPM